MKRIVLALLPAFTGCFLFSSGPSSQTGDTPEHLKEVRIHVPETYDVYSYADAAQVLEGQWARYRITEKASSYEITLAVVRREGEDVWMEVIEEDEIRRASARRVSPDGIVLRAFYREVGRNGTPSSVHPQEIAQRAESHGPVPTERTRSSERRERTLAGRSLVVTEVKIEFEDLAGRVSRQEWGWSKEVPALFASSSEGGLVSQKGEDRSVELVDFGTGHQPLVEIPR